MRLDTKEKGTWKKEQGEWPVRKLIETKDLRWLHVSGIQEQDYQFLHTSFKFHTLDYEDIRGQTHLAKVDTYKHYLFFVFHIPTYHEHNRTVGRKELYIFLADKQIVTVTHAPMTEVDDFIARLERNSRFRASQFSKGAAFVMYQILMEAFRQGRQIISQMAQEVGRLEEAINLDHGKSITVELGHARRNVLYLRHLIDPQRNIIASLMHIQRPFIPETVFVYFDDLQDDLDTVWLTADNLKLLLDGLFDVNEALLSHRTNEVITILTIMSASLMVPTFIAGFYGMNVPWLPFAQSAPAVSLLYVATFFLMLMAVVWIIKRPRQ
ncbi:magnesium transporter CorA family protein [Candidatus Parcubacteria bacterium]|nr:magnesium transporter CorA family protein [Candidatus Parcubacteria bacterium]